MDLQPYVDGLQRQLAAAAETGGDEARALIERLAAPLDAAIRLTLQDSLAAAAEEITCDLAPGSVELRLRGREPEFVVTPPPGDQPETPAPVAPPRPPEGDDGAIWRINVRMPEHLKSRIEQASEGLGLSVNAWLVRAAASALDRTDPGPSGDRRFPPRGQRYTGWAR